MAANLTQEGFDKMRKELEYLSTTRRREVVQAIAAARAHGDLKENAEYDAAKNEQGLLEKRIAELNDMLSTAKIIDESAIDTSKAYLGATLTLHDMTNDRELTYTLTSKEESNFKAGKISVESPVGNALLGKEVDAEVEITIPAGTLKYKIMKIER